MLKESNASHEATTSGGDPSGESTLPAKHTIYVLVRRDIPAAQQMVQAAHAAAEAGRRFYRPGHGIASLIVLTVADQSALAAARERLARKGISTETFFEPDFGIGESALATEPLPNEMRKHLMGWPLWRLMESGSTRTEGAPARASAAKQIHDARHLAHAASATPAVAA